MNLSHLKNFNVIYDIRPSNEFMKKHFPKAINVSFNALVNNHQKYFRKGLKYLIVCSYGFYSAKLVNLLPQYDIISLKGGFNNYSL